MFKTLLDMVTGSIVRFEGRLYLVVREDETVKLYPARDEYQDKLGARGNVWTEIIDLKADTKLVKSKGAWVELTFNLHEPELLYTPL